MGQIGTVFREKRKSMNLSLKEVENGTSIRMSYLQAIEDEHLEQLISPIYAQGFVRQYAEFLGIDGEEVIRAHPEIFQKNAGQEFDYGIGTLETRSGNTHRSDKKVSSLLGGAFFVLLLFFAWYFAKFLEVI